MSQEEEAKLLELDFHNKKKITLKGINPDKITISLIYAQRKNVKPETILYNLTNSISWNHI